MVSQLENKISVAKKSSLGGQARKRVLKKNGTTKEKIVVVKKSPWPGRPMTIDHFNSIAKSVGFSSVIMTAIVVVVTPSHVWILGPVIGAMAIFGISMGYFASK
jgi:hypothetical protein